MTRFDLADLEHPVIQAPMGGGPSNPVLAAAVSGAGGLGFLAAGYKTAEAVRAEIHDLRARTDRPFGVNVFVPSEATDPAVVERYADTLRGEVERYGTALGESRHDDDGWEEKLALVAEEQVPVVSFAFGCPSAGAIEALQRAGSAVWVTVTSAAEAAEAVAAGADALVVQGAEAGGHRGSFADREDLPVHGLRALRRHHSSPLPFRCL